MDILTVDDNHFNNVVLKMYLERLLPGAVNVVTAADGFEACAILLQQQASTSRGFHLIFLDLSMPEIDGYETFRKLKEYSQGNLAKLHVVACTGYAEPEEKKKCLDLGMTDYLIKPIELHKLK